ncbi:MAG: pyrimidine 5'-nucleotidase [Rhodobiaceae bacterium]|nr:pyrimidine 5'-nucleotidase [Rhodobiaceae bacterium]MCC0054216.1 pyrimidine 5'-nucleotidase [Rhodobiaceae bacterium]
MTTWHKQIDTWVFDLDNTLYPPRSNLFAQIDQRMGAFIAELLDVAPQEAKRIQKDYYRVHGTTLHGLMVEHGVDPHAFLAFVHDIDHSPIEADPALGAILSELPGRKFVLTNGSVAHAGAVMDRLGIAGHFEDVFDIVAADFRPKPDRAPYEKFLAQYAIEPRRAAMFEDLPRNLAVPKDLGMATVLVVDHEDPRSGSRAEWEVAGADAVHIDHVTGDLAAFLADIVAPPHKAN